MWLQLGTQVEPTEAMCTGPRAYLQPVKQAEQAPRPTWKRPNLLRSSDCSTQQHSEGICIRNEVLTSAKVLIKHVQQYKHPYKNGLILLKSHYGSLMK